MLEFVSRNAAASEDAVTATISACGQYRYTLTRTWDPPAHREHLPRQRCLWVMLNPSTADAMQNDPTIRRCIGIPQDFLGTNVTSIEVVNLYAYRATDPSMLGFAADPIGPDTDAHIAAAATRADICIAAWGTKLLSTARADRVLDLLLANLRNPRVDVVGFTKNHTPRHPLYLSGGVQPMRYCQRANAT